MSTEATALDLHENVVRPVFGARPRPAPGAAFDPDIQTRFMFELERIAADLRRLEDEIARSNQPVRHDLRPALSDWAGRIAYKAAQIEADVFEDEHGEPA